MSCTIFACKCFVTVQSALTDFGFRVDIAYVCVYLLCNAAVEVCFGWDKKPYALHLLGSVGSLDHYYFIRFPDL